ncbi:MAG: DMT family transporter [Pedosphaera sp.]|nr:DMT family transporter [Pedosphaera sp.]
MTAMFAALLTTLFFSLSAVSAKRATTLLSGTEVNLWRLVIAAVMLGLFAHIFGHGLTGPGLGILFLSGCVGFGLGDLAFFQALTRVGSRISLLLVHCLAAPMAAAIEWLWLGNAVSGKAIICGCVILTGVALALSPQENPHLARRTLWIGILFGAFAAFGQGFGAVLSRKAYAVSTAAGQPIEGFAWGMTVAYQRVLGGLLISGLFLAYLNGRKKDLVAQTDKPNKWRAWPWLMFNALMGPTLGVGCYQWSLLTHPTGEILPIIATTPLVVIPFAIYMKEEKPTLRSLIGGVIAIIGVIGMVKFRS